ncbi:MAG: adenylosuccinate lyase [Candidatus Omnitrophica bacterium]|nr:adenylosuccinate lyase [Candidatus Omnitrophota bacterium]
MIPRYSRPEMARLWTDQHKFRTWLKVELAVCEVRHRRGEIPKKAWDNIRKKSKFSVKRILEIEEDVKHDVIAFLTAVAENVGPDSRHIHIGMTSSDVLDTALAINMKEAMEKIIAGVSPLLEAVKKQALAHKFTPCMGRSHGIHAEPTTFGLKMAVWYGEIQRAVARLELAKEQISFGQISGAVGTCAHLPPDIEEEAMALLGLNVAPVSTQIIQRDRHAFFMSALASLASSLEKFAVEIRNLQRTEILEVEESFGSKQKGSSAMPHKKNPITAEQITGLARVIRSNSIAALENVALWHERDITHSSVERVIIPDSTILADYILARMTRLVENLQVYPENMQANIDLNRGLIYSQKVLLALAESGMTREKAYAIVQKQAMRAWKEKKDFRDLIRRDPEVKKRLDSKALKTLFDQNQYLVSVDALFKRAGLE